MAEPLHADLARTRRPVSRRRAGRDRDDVLAAAARVIAERGADATRFTDVSAASGVPVSSLQYYFGSREDMLVAAFRHRSRLELDGLHADLASIDAPWQRLERITEIALGGFGPDPTQPGRLWVESWRFALRDAELREDVLLDNAAWRDLIAQVVRDGVRSGVFESGVDPDRVAVQAVALFDGIGLPVALGDPAVAQVAAELVLDALATLLGHDRPGSAAAGAEPA
jgi:AcrR family transcriptional regulator